MTNGNKSCCAATRKDNPNKDQAFFSSIKKPLLFEKMVPLAGGTFLMGSDDSEGFPEDGEGPVREVVVEPFFIDETTVTNFKFAEFIKATSYKTEAERFGWSFVFNGLLPATLRKDHFRYVPQAPWWCAVPGACWNHPEGPHSDICPRMDHPVVHVSWNDAYAFCSWSGKRLPTEAEWEYAARGGLVQKRYPWGDDLSPGGEHKCNIWQGEFPYFNSMEDGYFGTAPARSFPANGYGLYNMSGNVWEWCDDWFSRIHNDSHLVKNPVDRSNQTTKLMRGGSFLCHHSYCNRYRVAARSSNTADSSTSNIGFRCVASPNE